MEVGDIYQIWMCPKSGVPPNHPLKNRVFHDFHHPFWDTGISLFLETPTYQNMEIFRDTSLFIIAPTTKSRNQPNFPPLTWGLVPNTWANSGFSDDFLWDLVGSRLRCCFCFPLLCWGILFGKKKLKWYENAMRYKIFYTNMINHIICVDIGDKLVVICYLVQLFCF